MDSTQQADGEKRVDMILIQPLQRRGLAKPGSLTKLQFDEMVKDLCARLAYMTEPNLMALEEQAASNPAGKDRDRFPIANRILEWAGQIQPPSDEASPLIRAVFAAQLGADALVGGWAPELLAELKKSRRWPNAYVITQIKQAAGDSVTRLTRCDEALARGDALSSDVSGWRARRLAALRKCRDIAALGQSGGVDA
ncbi:hypothetical protein SAMN04488005_1521 [Yoonia tamlensis]|uniref:Uncharacterized protein n=1 Tax=Yoonia tamlensis TaxID=390270 RepID=A0A1I6GED5_9RHOB|nr:hypothetical protein [Yoonia tamlensis]SFR40573.1 hypothetical protein SAMN04488005_1521 [Yoonia tamlensis]